MYKCDSCYVVFLDILGFKDIVMNKSQEYLIGIFEKIESIKNWGIYLNENNELISPIPKGSLKYKIMSDSIIVFIDSSIRNALPVLISFCSTFLSMMLENEEPIILRGGLSQGDMFLKEDIMFGRGMSNAYILESDFAKVPRIIIPHNIIDEYNNCDEKCAKMFDIYDDGDYYCIDYIKTFLTIMPRSSKRSKKRISDFINKNINSQKIPSVVEKYIYLKNCLDRL